MLVITDHFTCYSQTIVTSSQMMQAATKALCNHFITHYGIPEAIISDQGHNFESQLIKELCSLAQVKKLRTTQYHQMGNGQCERFNHTLITVIGTLHSKDKANWKDIVLTLTHAYNCTKSNAMELSPYFLMFCCKLKILVDFKMRLSSLKAFKRSHCQFTNTLQDKLAWAYDLAMRAQENEARSHKERYD